MSAGTDRGGQPAADVSGAARRLPRGIAVAFVLWGLWQIWRSSFVVDGQRHFCLADDAMISMTYARNLLEGYGPSWARWGEPVEGFTCPLWTLVMVGANAVPIPLAHRSLLIQLLSLAALVANLYAVRRLVREHFSRDGAAHVLPAVVLTAAYYPLNHWALTGMETGLQALVVTLMVHEALSLGHDGRGSHRRLFVLATAALLLRPDMVVLVALCLAVALRPRATAGEPRQWLPPAAAMVVVLGAYLAFRLVYYGDWLPNTYHLKLTGIPLAVRIARGAIVFFDFAAPIAIPLLVLILAPIPLLRERPKLALPLAVVVAYFAYSVWVGGDVWESSTVGANRFIAPAMPLAFVVLNGLANEVLGRWSDGGRGSRVRTFYVLVGGTAACLLAFNGLMRSGGAREHWKNLIGVNRPLNTDMHAQIVHDMRRLHEVADADAVVATFWAGVPAFFSDFKMADILGYNDRHIARTPAAVALTLDAPEAYRPGHAKWDWDYLVHEVRPDVVYQPRGSAEPRREEIMRRRGYEWRHGVWVRADSDLVR